jgi:Flp pilus assembly protein protease CpaA
MKNSDIKTALTVFLFMSVVLVGVLTVAAMNSASKDLDREVERFRQITGSK